MRSGLHDQMDSEFKREFMRRLKEEWLPAYCSDDKRRYLPDESPIAGRLLTEEDARDFLRALDSGVVSFGERQLLKIGRKLSSETLFTEGQERFSPRRVRLWLESLISAAVAGRLHFDYSWPVECIGGQSKEGAFDVVAFKPRDFEYIAVEVKKTPREVDELLANLEKCCAREHDTLCDIGSRENAHRKWVALVARRPALFWAVGPSPCSKVFEVVSESNGGVRLHTVSTARLGYKCR